MPERLYFKLGKKPDLQIRLPKKEKLQAQFQNITVKTIEAENYEGIYEVIPKVKENTILETKNKWMKEDVTILEIPAYEVSNIAGGTTLTIGKELKINGN